MIAKSVIFLLMATPALADCPVAADLERGIRIERVNGSVEVFRKIGDGLVEVRAVHPEGPDRIFRLGQGAYLTEVADMVNGRAESTSHRVYQYPMAMPRMPVPKAGAKWEVDLGVIAYGIGDAWGENLSISWQGQKINVLYGNCQYAAIVGEYARTGLEYAFDDVRHYIPALGFAPKMSGAHRGYETQLAPAIVNISKVD